MNDRNPILIGTAEEVDLLQPRVRAMMEKPGVYILGDTTRPGVTVVLAVIEPWQAFFMSPDSESVDPELFLPTVTFHGPYFGSEEPHPAPVVPEGWRITPFTGSFGDGKWEVYAPCGSGGAVGESDIRHFAVRMLLDHMAAQHTKEN